MSPRPLPVVEHSTLTLGPQLGQGGQGTVYQVANKKINEAEGGGWDVAYKEYATAVLPDLDAAALAAQVGLLGELSAEDGRWLCDKTAWPAAVVERHGRACGFLMRAVPDRFRFSFQSLAGTSTGTRRLANLEYLLNDDAYVAGVGLTISERDRLDILTDLATTLARLHRIGITVGDLSPKNLLFTTAPRPECFLIDCDAMRVRGATVLPQAETPDWQVPAGEEKATRASDVHKLALLAIRLFARDQSATDPTALTALSPGLGDLARASLNPDTARRPAPAAWAEQLSAASTTASTAPATAPTAQRTSRRSNAASAGRPGGGSAAGVSHGPAGTQPGVNWSVLNGVAAVVALIVIVVAFVATHSHSGSSSASDDSPQPTFSQDYTSGTSADASDGSADDSGGSGSSSDSGGATTTDPSTTAPSAEDQAFSDVSADDCLSDYYKDAEWSSSTPTTTSCSDTDAYFRVASVEHGTCSSDDMTWYHNNSDYSETNLCLDRNYVSGQCMFAKASGQTLSMYFNAVTPCEAGIPDNYQYTVQLTRVYPGGAPDDACGSDRLWKPGNGAVLCGKGIWKRHGLPDM
ncbi:lipopolysaccharide kinase InaA family protein [Streptomyces barringtoniae]|uniref:lipopolysaccharide kinase InaA family protein n=1 Tax=Streptomyces barringtoniae TaxID=2892029 RepID=UPI001E652A8D|nr:lipopolysaccharide kinase InaA family protein [Streptomyces barringtoniae]MCC5480432.1 lipopolysaccharide kinase InaA family protein [Streptomyces barringtoniae]